MDRVDLITLVAVIVTGVTIVGLAYFDSWRFTVLIGPTIVALRYAKSVDRSARGEPSRVVWPLAIPFWILAIVVYIAQVIIVW